MRAVLIGADLMYRQDGKLVPIEINTNTAWDRENRVEETLEEIFDLSEFKAFLNSHRITEVWVDGLMSQILVDFFNKEGITAVRKSDQELSEAEDQDNLLLLRTSYSNEALVDSFCRDKALFLDAIKDFDFGCDYVLKTDEGLEGSIAEIVDNGNYPNFIVKYRYPHYNIDEYPKLVKITSQKALKKFLNSEEMPVDFLLMPFYYNEDKLWEQGTEKRIQFFRHLSVYALVDDGLEAIPLGTYTKLCGNLENVECSYSSLGVLDSDSRKAFLDLWITPYIGDVLAEKGDLVLMADDTWKPVEELEVGDEIKSLDVPNKDVDIREHTGDYNVSYDELEAESTYETTTVAAVNPSSKVITKVKVEFTDGTDWWDTANSSYPTLDPVDGTVYFKTLDSLEAGDKIILLKIDNLDSPEFEIKEIAEISSERQAVEGYSLSVEGSHLFITRTSEDEVAYASIEHNLPSLVPCDPNQPCESTAKSTDGVTNFYSTLVTSTGTSRTSLEVNHISIECPAHNLMYQWADNSAGNGYVVSSSRTTGLLPNTDSQQLRWQGEANSLASFIVTPDFIYTTQPETGTTKIRVTVSYGTTSSVISTGNKSVTVPKGFYPKAISFEPQDDGSDPNLN